MDIKGFLFSLLKPAAPSGYMNLPFQVDVNGPNTSVSVSAPGTGGVSVKTANYTAVAGDCGQLLSFNSGSAVAYTLPATPPVVAVSRWQVAVENIGAGALTISATTAAKLDGVTAGTLVLAQNTGCKLYTDGTDYFTERGSAASGGGGSGTWAKEVPSGTLDGSNKTFTLAHTPVSNSVSLSVNGVHQVEGTDYSISGTTISMIIAPKASDAGWFSARYMY